MKKRPLSSISFFIDGSAFSRKIIVYSKKEQMVRMVLGADLIHMMTHKIISDIVGFLIVALAAIILLLPFTNLIHYFF